MSIRETLKGYGAKTKTADQVMRELITYDAWQAPVIYAMDVLKTDKFDRIAIWGTDTPTVPPGELWLFTDDEAANTAVNRGHHAGPYATKLLGYQLFEALPNGLKSVQVNPGSPVDQGWFIDASGIELTRLWAKAIRLEQSFKSPGDDFIQSLLDFDGYTIFVKQNGSIVTAVGAGGMKNPGMLFTAPDCADQVWGELGPQVSSQFQRRCVSGKQLFSLFKVLGVDGFVINPRGPGVPWGLDQKICEGIAEYLEMDAEAKRLAEGT